MFLARRSETLHRTGGRYRNPDNWNDATFEISDVSLLAHGYGYTGHEMLPEFGLINMNGRVYDPVLGRFLSPDNYVQDPLNPQNYNRFGYCYNNPFKFTDPSGEFFHLIVGAIIGAYINLAVNGKRINNLGDALKFAGVGALSGALGAGVGSGISSALAGTGFGAGFIGSSSAMTAGAGFWSGAAIGGGAGFTGGFVSGAGNSWLMGSDFADGLKAGLISGGIGAVVGGLLGGLNGYSQKLSITQARNDLSAAISDYDLLTDPYLLACVDCPWVEPPVTIEMFEKITDKVYQLETITVTASQSETWSSTMIGMGIGVVTNLPKMPQPVKWAGDGYEVFSLWKNYNLYQNGEINGSRLGIRAAGSVSSAVIGRISGPFAPLTVPATDLGFWRFEQGLDYMSQLLTVAKDRLYNPINYLHHFGR